MKRIARIEEIDEGVLTVIRSGSREFLVTRQGNNVTACGNICPHHGARLSEGGVHRGIITCPAHHARFDLSTGKAVSPPAFDPLTVYETVVENGDVFIGKPKAGGYRQMNYGSSPRFVIIGAGAAGISCAESLRTFGFSGKIELLSKEPDFPYDRTALTTSYYGQKGGGSLLLRDPDYFKMTGIDIRLNEEVSAVDAASGTLSCVSGSTISYDSLLLATGAVPRRLGVDGESLGGVHHIRSLADAKKLRVSLEQTGSLIVLGAGFLGLEIGLTAAALGIDVTVTAPETMPLETYFGETYSKRITRMLKAAGIRWIGGIRARAFSGETAVNGVMFDDGSRMETDAAVVAAGAAPAVQFAGIENLTGKDGVRVGPGFVTDDPRIYAAGDVAAAHAGHWVTAMRQGRGAAAAMCGCAGGGGVVPFFWTDLGDETLRVVGARGTPDSAIKLESGNFAAGEFLALWDTNGEITGAFSVGYDKELIDIEQDLREKAERS